MTLFSSLVSVRRESGVSPAHLLFIRFVGELTVGEHVRQLTKEETFVDDHD